MKLRTYLMLTLLPVLLANCVKAGDFCDLAEPMVTTDKLAATIVKEDRALAERMATQNKQLKACK